MSDFKLRGEGAQRWRIGVIHGPNLSNIGARNPERYGHFSSIDELLSFIDSFAQSIGVEVTQIVSNFEGEILEFIHAEADSVGGWVVNPAGLTRYGEPTRTALKDSLKPFVETHFTNSHREFPGDSKRHRKGHRFTEIAQGAVVGLRQYSYCSAILGLTMALDDDRFLGNNAQKEKQ